MEDNVRIKVIGIQHELADDETIELVTTGKWFYKNDKDYILYEDTMLTETGSTSTRVTVSDDIVSIIRTGATNTHLIFEKNISHILPYETPFGVLEIISSTKDITFDKTEDNLKLEVVYNLEINQMDMGQNIFFIELERL